VKETLIDVVVRLFVLLSVAGADATSMLYLYSPDGSTATKRRQWACAWAAEHSFVDFDPQAMWPAQRRL